MAPPPILTTSSTHTQNKLYVWVCPGTTSVPVYRPKHTFDLKSSHFGYAGFQEKFDTPPLKPTNTEPSFRKLNSPPTKLCMLFPAHLQARELCPQTYSLSLPLEWSQVTHIPVSIKSGGAYKPEKSAFYSTFARQLCDDTRLPGGLSAFPPHSQTFKPTQASFAHTNSQPSYSFLSVGGFLQSSAQPHESAARPLQRAAGHMLLTATDTTALY